MPRLTREDFAEMCRCKARPAHSLACKSREHQTIEEQVAEYLARNGRIQVIEPGVSGDTSVLQRMELASKGGKAASKKLSGVGAGAAAEFLGISPSYLASLCVRGIGPAHTMSGRNRRYTMADLRAWKTARDQKPITAGENPKPEIGECGCDLRTRLVGDGCAQCNPELFRRLLEQTA
jgi:hypothetical protein